MTTDEPPTEEHRALIGVVLHRAWVIALCALLAAAAAVGVSFLQKKEYSAAASLLFRDPAFDQKLFGQSFLDPSRDPNREAATNVRLVELRPVADRAARRLTQLPEVPRYSARAIERRIEVEPQGQADVVSVVATDRDPAVASQLANVFAEEYIAFRRDADRATIEQAQALVQRQLQALGASRSPDARSRRRSLENRSEELGILASLQTGNAELVERAIVPRDPSSPKPVRNAVLGLLLGMLLGVVLAFLIERRDRRFRSPEEIERLFRRPILGQVPELSTGAQTVRHEQEPFRMLRANLRYFNVDRSIRSVLITSAAPGDGKTTVSLNLAAAAAEAGERVLLLEADLRRPMLAGRLRLDAGWGLSTVLAGQSSFDDSVQAAFGADRGGAPDVLVAGPPPPNPIDLLESESMRHVLATASERYDLIIVDTPPTSVVPDAIPLLRAVDGVIVVSRLNASSRDDAQRFRDQLENLGARTLGIVVNFTSQLRGYYGYYALGDGAAAERDETTLSESKP